MKAISTKAYITSMSSRKDRSLRLSVVTPELTTTERAEFMNLQGNELEVLFNPLGDAPPSTLAIKKDVRQKSQSTRIYNVLYALWASDGSVGEFDTFYKKETEEFINYIKDQLPPREGYGG